MKYKIDKDSEYYYFSGNNLTDITSAIRYSKVFLWRNEHRFCTRYV